MLNLGTWYFLTSDSQRASPRLAAKFTHVVSMSISGFGTGVAQDGGLDVHI
jgi:hypothetical protein